MFAAHEMATEGILLVEIREFRNLMGEVSAASLARAFEAETQPMEYLATTKNCTKLDSFLANTLKI